MAEKGNAKVR